MKKLTIEASKDKIEIKNWKKFSTIELAGIALEFQTFVNKRIEKEINHV